MKVVVFGGSGFVGRWLIKALRENDIEVLCCDMVPPAQEYIQEYIYIYI